MKKISTILVLFLATLIFTNIFAKCFAQQSNQVSLNGKIKILESQLNLQHKLFKVIGENNVAGNGKIIQKITTNESFEIYALPLLEPVEAKNYQQPFIGKLFSENGYQLSEVSSSYGVKLATSLAENGVKKTHKFEFTNPNSLPLKVRFYYVQATKK